MQKVVVVLFATLTWQSIRQHPVSNGPAPAVRPDSVRLDNTSYLAGATIKWYWNFGDGTIDSKSGTRYTLCESGNLHCKIRHGQQT